MENTGRISTAITPTARRILFGKVADKSIDAELETACQVDRAHVVMLVERGLIDRGRGATLLAAIDELRASGFAPLRGRPAPRGLFLMYEDYLIESLGPRTGGVLQTARSRNDLNATTLRLRLRAPYLRLLGEALRLHAILLRRASRFADVVMPAYTHYQAAVPVTFGHYLAGIAEAQARDIAGFVEAAADLERSPLGAGAVGGTSLAIDQERTAALLGFEKTSLNSIDAVASRDFILRLLAALAIMGVTLSRLATDLLTWSTAEFGFISLPDSLVGSSSMMPQKRNPYLLEHVQGRSASALGAFVSALTAMHCKPFTNSIAVGTEAVGGIWKAFDDATEAATLARLTLAGVRPQPRPMLERAVQGYTAATEIANRLMVEGEMAFRSSHKTVGEIIREAASNGGELLKATGRKLSQLDLSVSLEGLDPGSVARASKYGGGPGAESLERCLAGLRGGWAARMRRKREQSEKWRASQAGLDLAVGRLCAATGRDYIS